MADPLVQMIGVKSMSYYVNNSLYRADPSSGAISNPATGVAGASSTDVPALLSAGCVLSSYAAGYQSF
jgi:hypothetical protein